MKQGFKRLLCVLCAAVIAGSVCLTACGGKEDLGEYQNLYIVETGLKTVYNAGETFDYGKVNLRAVYSEGEEKLTGTSNGVTHNELDMDKAGTQTLTFTYKEKSDSVDITIVKDELLTLSVIGKTAYKVGDAFDFDAFKVVARYSVTGDVELKLTSPGVEYTPKEIDTSKEGETELKVTYGGKTATVKITVTKGEIVETLTDIRIVSVSGDPLDFTVEQGEQFDYSRLALRLIYNTARTEDIPLSTEGVSYQEIDTSAAGAKELIVTYLTLTAKATVTVTERTARVSFFELPTSYSTFVADNKDDEKGPQTDDREHFMKAAGDYLVGDDNGFVFRPNAQGGTNPSDVHDMNVETTFSLELKGEDGGYTALSEEETAEYCEQKDGKPCYYYYFTANAVGKTFRLTVTLAEDVKSFSGLESRSIVAEIKVVDGYNVYDQTGLSVLDNLNVNNWKALKTAAGTLDWDTKPLIEYNQVALKDGKEASPVNCIILHGDIEIDPDKLPDNYFWDKDRHIVVDGTDYGNQGYDIVKGYLDNVAEVPKELKENLNGSLRDFSPNAIHAGWSNFSDPDNGDCAEDYHPEWVNMQKGIYNTSGTSISGNLFSISYKTEGLVHKLYTVHDGKTTPIPNPLSHWSLVKYPNEVNLQNTEVNKQVLNDAKPVVENLRITGKSPRLAESDGEPAHLMAFNTCMESLTLENTVISSLFVAVTGDNAHGRGANIIVNDSKIYDINSNMFYVWRATIDVKNSYLVDAGGPVFILCDGDRTGSPDDETGPHLIVDKASRIESFASGYEPWYALNDATMLFTYIQNINLLANGYLGINYVKQTTENEKAASLVNVVAIIIPEPENIMKPAEDNDFNKVLQVSGSVKRTDGDTVEEYKANGTGNTVYDDEITSAKQWLKPILRSGSHVAAVELADPIENSTIAGISTSGVQETYLAWAQNVQTTDWLFLQMTAGLIARSPLYPYFSVLIGSVGAAPARG